MNYELERWVLQRTRELDGVSRDLEAFAHPYRTICASPWGLSGYWDLVLEPYADQVPPDGRSLLGAAGAGAERAGQWIEGLLNVVHRSLA